MSTSRINVVALIAAAAAALAAQAQDGPAEPPAAGPASQGAAEAPTPEASPLEDPFGDRFQSLPEAIGEAPPPPAPPSNEIVASELEEVDPFVVGVLSPSEGGLPRTLWSGSDLAAVEEAASRTPGETGFLAASQLAARALLSGGAAPQGPGDRRAAAMERLNALLDLGRVDAVDDIVTQTPRGLADPEFAAMAVRARLAKHEITPACQVGDALPSGRDGSFWLRLRAACFAWADEAPAAQLTLDLAREADPEVADEDFTTLVFAAASKELPRRPPEPRDALESALAQSAGYEFTPEVLERLPLLVAVGLVRDQNIPIEARALAARRAVRSGAIPAEEYLAVLNEIPAPEGATAAELIFASKSESFPQAEALLHHAVAAADAGPFEIAEVIEQALGHAQTPSDFILTAQSYSDALKSLAPTEDLLIVAPQFALASAAIGDTRLAYAWLNPRAPGLGAPVEGFTPILNANPDFSRSPIDPTTRVALEAVVAAADPAATPRRLASVAQARLLSVAEADPTEQAAARRDAALLLALGAEASPELRRIAAMTAEEAPIIGDEAAQALSLARLAAQSGAMGETALYLALAAGDVGPANAAAVASVIEIARAAGLNEDARALAVESMLASRISSPPVETE